MSAHRPRLRLVAIAASIGSTLLLASLLAPSGLAPAAAQARKAQAASPAAAAAVSGGFTLIGLDSGASFTAQFNPKEIVVEKVVPWTKSPTGAGDAPELLFKQGEGRSMSFTLEFDTSAGGTDVHGAYIAPLNALAMVMDSSPAAPETKRRPTRVRVAGGAGAIAFEGVIESIDTVYTAFLPGGTPVRATSMVTLKETSRATYKP